MVRFVAVLIGAAIGFVSSPVRGQAEPSAAPLLFVAPDGTVTINPGSAIVPPDSVVVTAPASGGALPWVAGSAMGLSWSDGWGLWGNSTALGLSDRPQARKGFAEGSLTRASPQSAASVVLAGPSSNSLAACAGCGVVAQPATSEPKHNHNRSDTSYALPQEFVNPYALIRPRPRIVADAGIKAVLDFPKPREIKDLRPERANEQRSAASSNRSDEKRSEAADLKAETSSLSRSDKKQSGVGDVQTLAAASNGRDKEHAAQAEQKTVVESTRPEKTVSQLAEIKASVASAGPPDKKVSGGDKKALIASSQALSKASMGPSASNVGGGSAGQVPEPATWALTLFGVLGASLLRRRKR